MSVSSYPSPLQKIAANRAIQALEEEARGFFFAGDAEAARAAEAAQRDDHGEADYRRRRRDVKHRRARELQRTADELSKSIEEES